MVMADSKKAKRKRLDVRIWERDKAVFQRKAEEEGRSLSGWIIHTLKQSVRPSSIATTQRHGSREHEE